MSEFAPADADAAALRLAFERAVATYPYHLAAFLSRDAEAAFREWWGQFYRAIHDHRAGLSLLAELALLRGGRATPPPPPAVPTS